MKFFLEKQLIKFSCTYQSFSFCKILKKFLQSIQIYEDLPLSCPKWLICPEQNFFGTNHYHYFPFLPIGPCHCSKFKKNSYNGSRVMTMHLFWAQNGAFATKNFGKKLLISFSSTYWPFSLCKMFKKFLQQIQSYEVPPFLVPKWPICSNENFFKKHVNTPCSFHSCLSKCQK